MKNIFLGLLYFIAIQAFAQESMLTRSLTNAAALQIKGQMTVETGAKSAAKVFQMQQLSKASSESIKNSLAGKYEVITEPSVSKEDGTVFVLGKRGQGSQTEIKLILFKDGIVRELPVIEVKPNVILFKGGTIDLKPIAK